MSYVLTPSTIEQAVEMLTAHPGARPMSGGASLVAMKNARLVEPDHVINLAGISALRGFERQADGALRIGGMVRHREIADASILTRDQAMIRQAAGVIANRVVRNMGTLGGAVGNADPAADYLPVLACADARVELAGPDGLRHLAMHEYLMDWYETALQPGEFVAAVILPPTGHGQFAKGTASLTVQGVGRVKIHPIRQNHGHLAATFEYDSKAQRNAMICKLFSGQYTTVAPATTSTRQLMSSLWEKTFHG